MNPSVPPASEQFPSRPANSAALATFGSASAKGATSTTLWSQFAADTRSSYGFYGKDVDWDANP